MNWDEKYKPKKFTDIVGQDKIVKSIKSMKKNGELSHILFYGPWGTGKTSMAYVIKREFGIELIKFRGHDFRHNDIINVILDIAKHLSIKSYKAILLDDLEILPKSSQESLRGIMDFCSKICKFIITTNNLSDIDPGIQSRCKLYEFKAIKEIDAIKRLKFISKKQSLEVSDQDISKVLNSSKIFNNNGDCIGFDLRRCIKSLEEIYNERK